jgi:hypothetical protein
VAGDDNDTSFIYTIIIKSLFAMFWIGGLIWIFSFDLIGYLIYYPYHTPRAISHTG